MVPQGKPPSPSVEESAAASFPELPLPELPPLELNPPEELLPPELPPRELPVPEVLLPEDPSSTREPASTSPGAVDVVPHAANAKAMSTTATMAPTRGGVA